MARIDLCDPARLGASDRALYDRFPANLMRALLRTDCTAGYQALGFALRATRLDAKRRELVILRVASLSDSRYERMQHLPPAREAGWTDAEIAAIEAGRCEPLGQPEAALLRFVDECVERVRVSDLTFAELRRHLPEDEIAEATLLAGFYMMTARFLETLDIELDEAPCDALIAQP
ncbi:MAG TPA: carboxymuconolactone decarboxylase family protein [Aliidongia sp.]|nr:carboxymuconolactone decarboxylase family protein [Aliidongia sp.]